MSGDDDVMEGEKGPELVVGSSVEDRMKFEGSVSMIPGLQR